MLWAITSFFNPMNYRRRLENYRVFRRFLDAPLVTVELAFGDFQLASDDADILIQIRGQDVMWQKERLLNVALQHVPPDCEAIAWLDADVLFGNREWTTETMELLRQYPMVQLFETARDLPLDFDWSQNSTADVESKLTGESVAKVTSSRGVEYVFDEDQFLTKSPRQRDIRCGLGWAGRTEILNRHRFYDTCIVGSGDLALVAALYGMWHRYCMFACMGQARTQHYVRWARQFNEEVGNSVGFTTGVVYHLWHGAPEARQSTQRHRLTQAFDFDPTNDLILDSNGCWRWNSDKPEFHRQVAEYFKNRNEDKLPSPHFTAGSIARSKS